MLSSAGHQDGDCYEALTPTFCDGFEVLIPNVPKHIAKSATPGLLDVIHGYVPSLTIRNMLVSDRGTNTYIWFTLSPETSRLTPRTINEFTKVVNAMKLHAGSLWGLDKEESSHFEITKIDIAVDMKGAFMTSKGNDPYNDIKHLLSQTVRQILSSDATNFLSLSPISDLRVLRGDNNLDTCF